MVKGKKNVVNAFSLIRLHKATRGVSPVTREYQSLKRRLEIETEWKHLHRPLHRINNIELRVANDKDYDEYILHSLADAPDVDWHNEELVHIAGYTTTTCYYDHLNLQYIQRYVRRGRALSLRERYLKERKGVR